jgi:hypothetical protein
MKRYLLLIACIFFVAFSFGQQGFGFGVGFSTSKAPFVNGKYFFGNNAVFVGVSYQVFNDAVGKKEDDILPGSEAYGDGHYFFSGDFGYTRILNDKFSLSGEISIAQRTHFQNLFLTNALDQTYHRTLNKLCIVGAGAFVTYYFNETFGVFAGYNSIRQASIGLDVRFVNKSFTPLNR